MTEPVRRYGCFNRAPFKKTLVVPDGHFMDGVTRVQKMQTIPFTMSMQCEYARDPMGYGQKDERCVGCKWRPDATD